VDRTSNADSFPSLRATAARGLEQRLYCNCQVKSSTPPAGRGKRQIRELEVLQHKAQTILIELRGCWLTYEHYPATKTVGERYQITAVTLNTAAIAQDKQTLAGVSMSLTHALSSYRSKMQS